ncbi:MAG: hypothetical protein GY854_11775 [Deltaproteobacteria bacterium]|nr:hypothetical protein [Deltaproteobacteria bacterium]
MTPIFSTLNTDTIEDILYRAKDLLENVGIEVEDREVTELLGEHGAHIDKEKERVFLGADLVDRALESAPGEVRLYDRDLNEVAALGGKHSYFVPGSSALNIFDPEEMKPRGAIREDLDRLALLTEHISTYSIQSTAIVPNDVPQEVADRVRLFHALRGSKKPVVTGTFQDDGFEPMVRMLEAVRGSSEALREHPLAVFDCCPTPPLKWPHLTSRVIMKGAKLGIPAEIVPVPLSGATGPVTLHGALVQIAAENLSGIVISQCAGPGAPVIWGGCPMSFDMKFGTTPTGAPETMLLNAASAEIAKHLELPRHGYLALSDAKLPDMQAGFESAMGALTAVLSGMNVVSGAGMMSFIGCQSLEKLLFDAEICKTALRYGRGIDLHEDTNLTELFLEALGGKGFLSHKHTRKNYRKELFMPSELIDRSGVMSTASDAFSRCHAEVEKLLASPPCEPLPEEVEKELNAINDAELKKHL